MGYVEYVIGSNSGDEDVKKDNDGSEFTSDNLLAGIAKSFGVAFGNSITGAMGFDGSFNGSSFGGASAGKLPIPPGFFSDNILFNFVFNAEGNVAVKWVDASGNLATGSAIYGYDYPPGVHDKSFLKAFKDAGINPNDLGISFTNRGRKAIGGEHKGGAVYGYYSTPVPASSPYWKKFLPIYRDKMIMAWNRGASTVANPAERLALMHTMYWAYGGTSLNVAKNYITNDKNGRQTWPHRLQMAQKAISMG